MEFSKNENIVDQKLVFHILQTMEFQKIYSEKRNDLETCRYKHTSIRVSHCGLEVGFTEAKQLGWKTGVASDMMTWCNKSEQNTKHPQPGQQDWKIGKQAPVGGGNHIPNHQFKVKYRRDWNRLHINMNTNKGKEITYYRSRILIKPQWVGFTCFSAFI